jgi:PAS domain S-box-containing protein
MQRWQASCRIPIRPHIQMDTASGPESNILRDRVAALEAENAALRSRLEVTQDPTGYWSLIRSAPIPMFVNFQNRIVLANDAALSALGARSESDLLGHAPLDFIHPDFHAAVKQRIEQIVSLEAQSAALEERFLRLDGSYIDVEVTGWAVPYGGATAIQVMFVDISARKNAERALRESERIYRAIGETIDYGVWICDPEGHNIYASESFLELVGQTQAECSEFGWGNVLHPDDAERTIAAWKECVRSGGIWDIEHRFLGVDGRYHPILARGIPVRDDEGRIVCWAGINLDISRMKRTEEELARSNADLERFADVVAHDLQAPLRSIAAFSRLLVEKNSPAAGSEHAELVDFIQGGIRGMEQLINGLLAYSRATRPAVVKTLVDPHRIVESLRVMYRDEIEDCGARIQSDLLPQVMTDERHLAQVLQNLIGNALKYRGTDPPNILISAEREGDEWVFTVADNGAGIEAKEQTRVFDMFRRLHGDEVPGAGIGLAICKRLVLAQGGRIWVESEPGAGARFCFTIPA